MDLKITGLRLDVVDTHVKNPGSRGGRLIGRTKSGEPIYASSKTKRGFASKRLQTQKSKEQGSKTQKPEKREVKLTKHSVGSFGETQFAVSSVLSTKKVKLQTVGEKDRGKEKVQNWASKKSFEELKSIRAYTDGPSDSIVRAWRKGKTDSNAYKLGAKLLSAIDDAPVWKGTMYRGMALSKKDYLSFMTNILNAQDQGKKMKITSEAMQSFSRDGELAKTLAEFRSDEEGKPHVVIMHVQGSSGKMVDSISGKFSDEAEVIMSPGEKLSVDSFTEVESGENVITHVFLKG